jgi:hypothetical protein
VQVFSSLAPTVALTVVFTVTGLYALLRFAALVSGTGDGDRVVELFHLLMSIAMIAMTWAWSGGPDTTSGLLQIVVFGLFGLWLLNQLIRPFAHPRATSAYHLVAAIAMVWMVPAMPEAMGNHAGTAAVAAMPDMDMSHHTNRTAISGGVPDVTGMPAWARVVSIALVLLLVSGPVMWASRAFGNAESPRGETPRNPRGTAAQLHPAPDSGAVASRVALAGHVRFSGSTVDAGCHMLMSLGMAAMLLTML